MPPLLKCPQCAKRGVRCIPGPLVENDPKGEKEIWELRCRYCKRRRKIAYCNLLRLMDADPVFIAKRQKQLAETLDVVAREISDLLGVQVWVSTGPGKKVN